MDGEITREDAKRLVYQALDEAYRYWPDRPDCVIVDEATIERDFGWVFFYQSREYLDTGKNEYQLAGNAAYIVDRRTGELHVTGTAEPVETYIENFEKYGTPHI